MQPLYELNNTILKLFTSISEKLGEVNAAHLHKPSPEFLRTSDASSEPSKRSPFLPLPNQINEWNNNLKDKLQDCAFVKLNDKQILKNA